MPILYHYFPLFFAFGSCGRAVAGLRIVWNAIIDPPVPGGSAQAAHRHCTRPFPGESGLATRDYVHAHIH